MTHAEIKFKLECNRLLESGVIPTPKVMGLRGYGNGRNLNGAQCQWREEVMRAFGCRLVGVGPQARWRLP